MTHKCVVTQSQRNLHRDLSSVSDTWWGLGTDTIPKSVLIRFVVGPHPLLWFFRNCWLSPLGSWHGSLASVRVNGNEYTHLCYKCDRCAYVQLRGFVHHLDYFCHFRLDFLILEEGPCGRKGCLPPGRKMASPVTGILHLGTTPYSFSYLPTVHSTESING